MLCVNCKHLSVHLDEHPCRPCFDSGASTHWEPADQQPAASVSTDGWTYRRIGGTDSMPTLALIPPAPKAASALAVQEGGGHYKDCAIQPIEYIHANSIPFAEGSIIKYVSRWRKKNGIQDLKKARHFIDLLIELEEKKAK